MTTQYALLGVLGDLGLVVGFFVELVVMQAIVIDISTVKRSKNHIFRL